MATVRRLMESKMAEFSKVFETLRGIMLPYAAKLDCTSNTEDCFYLNTKHIQKNKKPLFFGSVQINKNYVSYHLMPVYVNPNLLTEISPDLKKRMQGKSCFNFTSVEPSLLKELAALTKAGFKDYQDAGYL